MRCNPAAAGATGEITPHFEVMCAEHIQGSKRVSGEPTGALGIALLLSEVVASVAPWGHYQVLRTLSPHARVEIGHRQRVVQQSSAQRKMIRNGSRVVVDGRFRSGGLG